MLSYESIPFPISTSFVYMSLTNSHGLQIYWCVFHSYCMLLGVSFMCFGFIYFLILELEMKEQALFETCYIPVAEGRATRLAEIQNDQLNFCLEWICITSAYILWTKESQIESWIILFSHLTMKPWIMPFSQKGLISHRARRRMHISLTKKGT